MILAHAAHAADIGGWLALVVLLSPLSYLLWDRIDRALERADPNKKGPSAPFLR